MSTLSRVITKGLTKSGRITELTTKVIDQPGHLMDLLQAVGSTGANIMSVEHKREAKSSEVNSCVVSMVLETRNPAHVQQIWEVLSQAGYEILD